MHVVLGRWAYSAGTTCAPPDHRSLTRGGPRSGHYPLCLWLERLVGCPRRRAYVGVVGLTDVSAAGSLVAELLPGGSSLCQPMACELRDRVIHEFDQPIRVTLSLDALFG